MFCTHQKHQSTESTKTHPNKSAKRYKRTVGYGGPTKPIIVLPYVRTKTNLLGPFKKLLVLMTSFTSLLNDLFKVNKNV